METDARRMRALERQLRLTRGALGVVFVLFGLMTALAMWSAQQTLVIANDALDIAGECEVRRGAMAVAIGRYDQMLVTQMQEHEVALGHLAVCQGAGFP